MTSVPLPWQHIGSCLMSVGESAARLTGHQLFVSQNKRRALTRRRAFTSAHRPSPRHTLIHGRRLTWPRDRFVPDSASILAHFRSCRINFQPLPVRFRWCVAPSGRTPRWRHSATGGMVTWRHCVAAAVAAAAAAAGVTVCRLYGCSCFKQAVERLYSKFLINSFLTRISVQTTIQSAVFCQF